VCTYTTKKRKPGPTKGSTVSRRRISLSSINNSEQYSLLADGTLTLKIGQQTATVTSASENHEEIQHSIGVQLPVPDPGSSSHDSISNGAQSLSANSWKGYRMIDVQSETSIDSLAVAQWGLSQEAELDL
jgi:hypothetical protein